LFEPRSMLVASA